MNNNVCSICKQKDLPVDLSKIKSIKIKLFINNNRINKEDYSLLIKKCNCNKKAHKFCILLNIIFNYEIKCPDCNSFYNISVTKKIDNGKKCFTIFLIIFLFFIHIIFYGCTAALILFNLDKFKMNDFNNIQKEKYMNAQFFFALIIFSLNSFFVYKSIKILRLRFKFGYKYFININDKSLNNKEDSKYFESLNGFYRAFYKYSLKYLVCKRNETFFSNKINYNKEYLNIIKNNNIVIQYTLNGSKEYTNNSKIKNNNNEDILKMKNNNNNNDNKGLVEKSKTAYLYKKWNPKGNEADDVQNVIKKTCTIKEEGNYLNNNGNTTKNENKDKIFLEKKFISFGNVKSMKSLKEEEKNK